MVSKYHKEEGVARGDKVYRDFLERRDVWDSLETAKNHYVEEVVLAFPNKWSTRIPGDCVPKLTSALKQWSGFFKLLRGQTLPTVDFCRRFNLGQQTQTLTELITMCFESISTIKAGKRTVGFTGTSKILHMILPDMFVMCDDRIANGYGFAQNAKGYTRFLVEMSGLARAIVDEYCRDHKAEPSVAVSEILKMCRDEGKPFTKTLDEFNYATYTLEL